MEPKNAYFTPGDTFSAIVRASLPQAPSGDHADGVNVRRMDCGPEEPPVSFFFLFFLSLGGWGKNKAVFVLWVLGLQRLKWGAQ